jgi:hypothetical protein
MKNIKVSTRLQAGFGLLTAFMLVLAAIALYGLSELDASLDGIARVNNEETRLANELRSSAGCCARGGTHEKAGPALCGRIPATRTYVR